MHISAQRSQDNIPSLAAVNSLGGVVTRLLDDASQELPALAHDGLVVELVLVRVVGLNGGGRELC